jgi:hypothetical protein
VAKTILLRGIEVVFGADVTGFEKGLKSVTKSLDTFQNKARSVVDTTVKVLAPIGATLVKVGMDFDNANAQIRRSVSATETELDSLSKSLRNVYATDDASFKEVSTTLEGLYQSFRQTGAPLEQITRTVLDMNDVFGDSAPKVSELEKVFKAWNLTIQGSEAALNLASAASRQTGADFGELIGALGDGKKVFDALGLSFAESTALLASFEKQGMSTGQVLAGLKKGVQFSLAKGQNPAEIFREILAASQDAARAQEVYNKTVEFAGTKVGPLFAKSILANKISLDEFTATLMNTDETIGGVAEQTATFQEKLAGLKNAAVSSLIPIGEVLLEYVTPAIKQFTAEIRSWAPDIAAGLYAVEAKFYEWQARLLLNTAQFASQLNQMIVSVTGRTGANATQEIDGMINAASELTNKVIELRNKASQVKGDIAKGLEAPIQDSVDKAELLRKKFEQEIPIAVGKTGEAAEKVTEKTFGTEAAKKYGDGFDSAFSEEITGGDYEQSLTNAHENSINAYTSLFENAITGVTFDLEDSLKQVAVGFAAEIAASLSKGFDVGLDFSSPQGLGSSLAKGLGENLLGGVTGSGSIFEGLKMSALGLEGPMTEAQAATAGLASSAGIAAAALGGAALTFKGIRDAFRGVEDNSSLGMASRAQAAFTTGGFSEIARLFSGGGKKDPEANAREAFANKLSDLIRQIDGIMINASDGQAKLESIDIFGGRDKFDPGKGGFDFLQSLDAEAQNVFTGLGTAFKEIFEIKDSDGAQFGAILSENLLGDIDNARLLVQQLGLDFDTLKDAVLKTALDGSISWLEFNSTVAGLSSAFEPGLAAVGAVGEALDELKNSSGRGFKAVKSVKDIAQEALEAGAKSMEDFRAQLVANGASAEEAQQILDAAAGRGVTSLEQLAGASDELAGSIAGDLEAMGFGYKQLSEDVLSVKSALDQINQVELKAKDLVVNVKVNDPKGAIDGQIESSAMSSSTTESPITRSYSHGGVSNSVSVRQARMRSIGVNNPGGGVGTTYNIDARGADAGVERRIISALQAVEDRAVRRSVNAMVEGRSRGRY